MEKKLLFVVLVLILSLIANGFFYFSIIDRDSAISTLEQQIHKLEIDFNSLNSSFQEYKKNHNHSNTEYDELLENFEELTENYEKYQANHTYTNSEYTTMQTQTTNLQNQLDEINQNYQDLQEEYDNLLDDYNSINEPVSDFDTIDDLQIELNVNKTTYSYTESIFGYININYLNGTAFQGTFIISIDPEFGTSGGVTLGENFEVNGSGSFVAEPPYSFFYGPGAYSIHLTSIYNSDGYVVASGSELYHLFDIIVEAK